METTNHYNKNTNKNEKTYIEPIVKTLNFEESSIIKVFNERGIEGVIKKDCNFPVEERKMLIIYLLKYKLYLKQKEKNDVRDETLNKVRDILTGLHENGGKHIFHKNVYLEIHEEYKKYREYKREQKSLPDIAFSLLFTNCLDLFHDLDNEVVNIILENQKSEGANMILLNIKSFGKIDIIKVLNELSKRFGFPKSNLYNKIFYRSYNESKESKEKMIKDLIDAGYLSDLRKSYEDESPLEKIGITKEEFERIVNKQ